MSDRPATMDPAWRTRFEEDGFIVIPDLLEPSRAERLGARLEGLARRRRSPSRRVVDRDAVFIEQPFAGEPQLCDLVDEPTVLAHLVGLLGSNIQIHSAVGVVTGPRPDREPEAAETGVVTSFGWHRDGGRMDRDTAGPTPPRLTVKVGFFLSDVSQPGRGNLEVVPGSHLLPSDPEPNAGEAAEFGTTPVCGPPGSAVLFDRRLWHTAGVNRSAITRRALFCGYGPRWIHQLQDMPYRRRWRRFDPVRRQLLGEPSGAYGRFFPQPSDLPLQSWVERWEIACADQP